MDTCDTAGDEICQDGGRAAFGSKCEFGTDCSDCGPRVVYDAPLWIVSERRPSDPAATKDAGPGFGLDDGLALGGCLLVAVLLAAGYVWHRKRLMQNTLDAKANAPPKANAPRTVARTWRTAHLNAAARGRGDAAYSTCAVQPGPGLDTVRESQ